MAALYGRYFFADYAFNQIWSINPEGGSLINHTSGFSPDVGSIGRDAWCVAGTFYNPKVFDALACEFDDVSMTSIQELAFPFDVKRLASLFPPHGLLVNVCFSNWASNACAKPK